MRSVNGQFGKLHICFGKMIFYLFTLLPFSLFISCTQDAYEKGEGAPTPSIAVCYIIIR